MDVRASRAAAGASLTRIKPLSPVARSAADRAAGAERVPEGCNSPDKGTTRSAASSQASSSTPRSRNSARRASKSDAPSRNFAAVAARLLDRRTASSKRVEDTAAASSSATLRAKVNTSASDSTVTFLLETVGSFFFWTVFLGEGGTIIGFLVVISRNRSTQFSSWVVRPHRRRADLSSLRVQPGGARAASFLPRSCLVNVEMVQRFLRACSSTLQAPAPWATRLRALAPTSPLSVSTRQTSSTWQSASSQPAKARMASACKDAASFAGSPAACRAG
mmetsp:Transcript_9084/g.26508  ORF Transcript_9084/g.26508 Transcript_9084/m.26508 type:complete len:277 (-) Transcript_9084:2128-2958(-)